jgi:NADH-quinone oxidoreductase subunit L
MNHVALLIPLLPLVGFLTIMLLSSSVREPRSGWIAAAAVGGSFVATVITFFMLLTHADREVTINLFSWLSVGSLHVNAALLIDPLSITMCLFVTGISTLIHLYSIGYMHGERDFTKFFLYLNAFVFSMLVLVTANNLVLTFVGWEGVGVCSYWLVSYYFDKDAAASAGKKAFLYNRARRRRAAAGDVLAVPLRRLARLPDDLRRYVAPLEHRCHGDRPRPAPRRHR